MMCQDLGYLNKQVRNCNNNNNTIIQMRKTSICNSYLVFVKITKKVSDMSYMLDAIYLFLFLILSVSI